MDEEESKQYQKARKQTERLLAQHPRTVFEMKRKLAQKKFSQEIINKIISDFTAEGFLDDKKYIGLWLENRIKYRPCGKILCLKKLLALGLERKEIELALDELLTKERELELAESLSKRKIVFYRNLDKQKRTAKIASFLKSKGFSDELIIEVLERLGIKYFD